MTFPVKVSLAIVQLIHKFNSGMIPVEQVRDGLINTHGIPNPEKGGGYEVSPGTEGYPKFLTEYTELLGVETEIDFSPVALPDSAEVSPALVMALEKFIVIG